MAILKSEVIGKPISSLKGITTGGKHPIWYNFTVDAVDFLSRCTLKYSKSYGASYKIDPTSELTIIHTDGTKYPVDSYKKLLTMVITDYIEPTGATMPPNIRNYRVKIKNTTKVLREKLHKALLAYGEPVDPNSSLILPTTMVYENFRFDTSDDVWYCTDTVGTTTEISIEDFLKLLNQPQEQPMPLPMNTPTQPQPGTHWERLKDLADHSPKGEIVTVERVTTKFISFSGSRDLTYKEFLNRFKPRPDLDTPASEPTQRRGLAFYKESGEPWTYDEYVNIAKYCGDNHSGGQLSRFNDPNSYKYVYDDGDTSDFMYNWNSRDPEYNPEKYKILSYESVFETPTKPTKTTKPKSKPVTQPEPIIPTPIKEKPMATKPTIKETASTLVAANKDAAILAAKLEAGKILNRQVIKLIKPKLHPLVRGYADSPLASVVLANVVGFAIKQYAGDNAKAGQLAEMMLQASAVESVSALNIEGLIDDLLSSVKLPKSVRAELNDLYEDYE